MTSLDFIEPTLPSMDLVRDESSELTRRRVGERLGDYLLCHRLASGGMATVYLARTAAHAGIQRFVALKRIHDHLAEDPEFVSMFLDEARVASQLQHANVCSVIDFDEVDGTYYLAMEYLEGEPLSRVRDAALRLESNPTHDAARVARIVADACEGLHAAHELRDADGAPLNVVHRDVSPDNLFVTYDGVTKIVDFGIASGSHQQHKTETGIVKGKFAYVQPEALAGKPLDRRADVWGMGVVMWELLTGKRLFYRDTDMDTLRAVQKLEVQPPSEVRPGLPVELDLIVLRALGRDPDDRYPTTREMARAITQFLADQRQAVGLAELAEWMERLFPDGRAKKRRMLEDGAHLVAYDSEAPTQARHVTGVCSTRAAAPITPAPRSRTLPQAHCTSPSSTPSPSSSTPGSAPPSEGTLRPRTLATSGSAPRRQRPVATLLAAVACTIVITLLLGPGHASSASEELPEAHAASPSAPPPVAPRATGTSAQVADAPSQASAKQLRVVDRDAGALEIWSGGPNGRRLILRVPLDESETASDEPEPRPASHYQAKKPAPERVATTAPVGPRSQTLAP